MSALIALLLVALAWFVWSGGPYPTPEAAAEAYVESVEGRTGGSLTGEIESVTVQGDTAQVVVERSGSHARQQILVVTQTSAWAGLRTGWDVQPSGSGTPTQ